MNQDDKCIAGVSFMLDLKNCKVYLDIQHYTASFDEMEISIQSSSPDISSSISYFNGVFTYENPIEQLNQSVSFTACHVFECILHTYRFTCDAVITIRHIPNNIAYPGIVFKATVLIESNGAVLPYATFSGIWIENSKPVSMTINSSTGEIYWLPDRDEELRVIPLRIVAQIDNDPLRTAYYDYELLVELRYWPLFNIPIPSDTDKECIIDTLSSDCKFSIQKCKIYVVFDTFSHYDDEFVYKLTSIPSYPEIYYIEENQQVVWKRSQLIDASDEDKETHSAVLYLEATDSLGAKIYSEGFVIYPNWIPEISDLEIPVDDMEKYVAYKNIPWSRTFTITDGPRTWPNSPSYFQLSNIVISLSKSQSFTLTQNTIHWTPSYSLTNGSSVSVTIQYTDIGTPPQTVTRQFFITVYNDSLPVCLTIPDSFRLVRVNQEYTIDMNDCKIYLVCSDNDNDFIEYTLLQFPTGMTHTNNLITWTPTDSQLGLIYEIQLQLRERIKNGSIHYSFILRAKSVICIDISTTQAYAYLPFYGYLSICSGTTTVSIQYLTYEITSPSSDIQISNEGVISWLSPFILNPTNTVNLNEVSIIIKVKENHREYGYVYDTVSLTYILNIDISTVKPTFLDTLPMQNSEKAADERTVYRKEIQCMNPTYILSNSLEVDLNGTPGIRYQQQMTDYNLWTGLLLWEIPHLRNSNLTTIKCTSSNEEILTYSILIFPVLLEDAPPTAVQPIEYTPFIVTEGQTSRLQVLINDVDTYVGQLTVFANEDLTQYSNLILYPWGYLEWTPDTIPTGATIIDGKITGSISLKISDSLSTVPFSISYLFTVINDSPIVSYLQPFQIDRKETAESAILSIIATDQDLDSLIYSVDSPNFTNQGPKFIWHPLKLESFENVVFTVSDGKGGSASMRSTGCQGVECRTWPYIMRVINVSGCQQDGDSRVNECKVFIPEDEAYIEITGRNFGTTKPEVRVGRRVCTVIEGSYSYTSLRCRVPIYQNDMMTNLPISITRTDRYKGDTSQIYVGLSYKLHDDVPVIKTGNIFNHIDDVRVFLLNNEGYYSVPVYGERFYTCECNAYTQSGRFVGTGRLKFKNSDIGDCWLESGIPIDTVLTMEVCCEHNGVQLCSGNDSFFFKVKDPKIVINSAEYSEGEIPSEGHSNGGYYVPIILSNLDISDCVENRILIQVNSQSVQARDICSSYKAKILIPSSKISTMRNDYIRISINNGYSWTRDLDSIPFKFTGYCSIGQYINKQWCKDCEIGHYCDRVFTRFSIITLPRPCQMGYYQPNIKQSVCLICPLGRQCFCRQMSQYEICDAGYLCDTEGTIKRWKPCIGGFYCKEGAYLNIKDKKNYGVSANTAQPMACPENTYCLSGVYIQVVNTDDKYTPQPCHGFCPIGSDNPIGEPDCVAGEFCPNSKTCDDSMDYMLLAKKDENCKCTNLICKCSRGYFCGAKLFTPVTCEKGTYQPNVGMSSCLECPEGYYCPWSEYQAPHAKIPCEPGNYCQKASDKPTQCGQGTYQSNYQQIKCDICPIGYTCSISGMAYPTICSIGGICPDKGMSSPVPCPEGYYCEEGTNVFPNPTSKDLDKISPYTPKPPIICTTGHYCPVRSSKPLECPLGTYNDQKGKVECDPCIPGFLCLTTGLATPMLCPVGFYCIENKKLTCPGGYYCPTGTQTGSQDSNYLIKPIPCRPGTYCKGGNTQGEPDKKSGTAAASCSQGYFNTQYAQFECIECPGGYECAEEGTITPSRCPLGRYRPEDSTSIECIECPEGTYNPEIGADSLDKCIACPAGIVCTKVGISTLTDENTQKCPAGFFCPEGTSRAKKTQNKCPAGTYCFLGTKSEEEARSNLCPAGRMCDEATGAEETELEACDNSIATCEIGIMCPVDGYCPKGTPKALSCPPGTISEAGAYMLEQCYRDPETFYEVNIINRKNAIPTVHMEPLTFNKYQLDFLSTYSKARMPEDFQLVISIVYDQPESRRLEAANTRVLIISDTQYGTKQSIPLVLDQKSILSPNFKLSLNIMSNLPADINFELEYLEGNVRWDLVIQDDGLMVETQSVTSKLGFMCVLTRDLGKIFEDPINIYRVFTLNDDSELENIEMKLENYFTISLDFQAEDDSEVKTSFYNETLWDTLPEDSEYFSITYLPYITDCIVGYGAFVPINSLIVDKLCEINSDPRVIGMYDWDVTSDGIYCDYSLVCDYNLDITLLDRKLRWYETSTQELNSDTTQEDLPPFYITKKQLSHDSLLNYINALPDLDLELIPVMITRKLDSTPWREGDVPDNVNLKLKYYQRSQDEIEIIEAELELSNFRQATDRNNTFYEFRINVDHLTWGECLDSLVYSREQYAELMFTLSLTSMCIVGVFVVISLVVKPQKIIPRFIGVVLNQTINSVIGLMLGSAPVITTAYIIWVILEDGRLFALDVGNFTDKVPIKGAYDDKAIDYRAGRFGMCLVIIGLFAMRCSATLFIPLKTDNAFSYKEELEKFRQQDFLAKTQGPFMANIILTLLYSVVIDSIGDFPTFTDYPYLYIIPITAINYGISLLCLWLLRQDISTLSTKYGTSIALFSMILNAKKMSSVMFSYGIIITIRFVKQAFLEKYNNYLILNPITKRLDRILEPREHLGTQKRIYTQQLRELADKSISIVNSWFYAMYLIFIWLFYDFMNYNMPRECYYHLMIFFIYSLAWEPVLQFCVYWIRQTRDKEFKIGRVLNQAREHYAERTTQWALSNWKLNNEKMKMSLQVKDLFIAAFSTQYYTALFIVATGYLFALIGIKLFQQKSYSPFQDYYFFPIMVISN